MKRALRLLTLGVVVVAAVALVVYRQRSPADRVRASPPAPAVRPASAQPSVLLFADLREADGRDSCALIIGAVREAARHGVSVTEIDAGGSPELREKYRIVVEPTVILLDRQGGVIARREGEDGETVSAIRNDMARLAGGRS